MRSSKQRDAVLKAVTNSYEHPTASDVYNTVKEEIPNISLGTVYRDLSQLAENGLIEIVDSSDGKAHYEGNLDGHLHFVCEKCGKIFDIFCKPQLPDELKQFEKNGFLIRSQRTVFYGLCENCRSAKE